MRLLSLIVLAAVPFAGVPLFAQEAQITAAPASGASLPAQPLGVSDVISVSVFGVPELSAQMRIAADGTVRPKLLTPIKVAGLGLPEIEAVIAKAYIDAGQLNDPYVTVSVVEYQSHPITVSGAVVAPTTFQATRKYTLIDALNRSGGLSKDAGKDILVIRTEPGEDGKTATFTKRVLVRALFEDNDPAANLELSGGEEVRVPQADKVTIVGNIKNPGLFPVPQRGDMTVFQLLALAGGTQPYYQKDAYIYRREASGDRNEIRVPLQRILDRKAEDVKLEANDILYVPDSRKKRLTAETLEKLVAFGAGVGTALIIYGTNH